jgi:hypothetical protein
MTALEQFTFQWDDDDNDVHFEIDQHPKLDFIALAHWNNSLQVEMSLNLDTLSRFRANQSLFLNTINPPTQIRWNYSMSISR